VYRTIRPDDPECQRGAQIHWALDLMKDKGAVKMLEIERQRDFPRVALSNYDDSRRYTIADYVTLFGRGDKNKANLTVRMVKKSLAEGRPVIIGMNTPNSFMEAEGVWQPRESSDDYYGGHAMCVVGYDDERSGGAFEVMNSWGRKWGNGGFIWIPYKTFSDFVMEGYEMIENLAAYSDTVKYAGTVQVETRSITTFQTEPLTFIEGVYRVSRPLSQGTEFRFVAGSSESAYVYAFAASKPQDGGEFYSSIQLFPPAGISPLLNYRDSMVTLPGEDKTLVLDETPGMEYLVVLYAKQALIMPPRSLLSWSSTL
jgi:hypothetical protein